MYKSHYIDCLIKELGIDNSALGNPTYTPAGNNERGNPGKHLIPVICCNIAAAHTYKRYVSQ